MDGFLNIWFQELNFIISFAIFIILSLLFIRSLKKYDILASTLFLKRNDIKAIIYTGYFGLPLLITGNLLALFGQTIAELKIISHFLTVYGLCMILFMAIGLYVATDLSQSLKKNEKNEVEIMVINKNNFVHWLVDKIKF